VWPYHHHLQRVTKYKLIVRAEYIPLNDRISENAMSIRFCRELLVLCIRNSRRGSNTTGTRT
jgi:hypothetical protein